METTVKDAKKKGKRKRVKKLVASSRGGVKGAGSGVDKGVDKSKDKGKDGEERLKKFTVNDYNLFVTNIKDYLIRNGKDFQFISEGTTERIIYGGKQWTYFDRDVNGGSGHHLNRFFMKDVDDYIEANKGNIMRYDSNYREQMFNLDAIERNLGHQSVMIDINDCYWTTAFNLGYITEETYMRGLMGGKAWKLGRNACIGSLAKTKIIIPYKNGKPNHHQRKVILPNQERMWIRNHIIDHVHTIFNDLFNQIGDTFYMFLTDCLVTHYLKLKDVEKYLRNHGYRVKNKPVEFVSVDRTRRIVRWLDFGVKKEDLKDLDKPYVERYCQYNNAQIIQWTGGSGIGKFGLYL